MTLPYTETTRKTAQNLTYPLYTFTEADPGDMRRSEVDRVADRLNFSDDIRPLMYFVVLPSAKVIGVGEVTETTASGLFGLKKIQTKTFAGYQWNKEQDRAAIEYDAETFGALETEVLKAIDQTIARSAGQRPDDAWISACQVRVFPAPGVNVAELEKLREQT